MRIGIIGCGLIGQKRAQALGEHTLAACADVDIAKAERLAKNYPDCQVMADWCDLLKENIDIVVVATPHNSLAEISVAACAAGKHVLVEKPAGKTAGEVQKIIAAAKKYNVLVRVGFNHRYHPALQKAKALIKEVGELMFIRARYGHGGRLGYDQEWRAQPEISGGGELIDQGMHVIDLSRWFLGDFVRVAGKAVTYYWNMVVDDNAFLTLETENEQIAFLQVSCTEWKNMFSFEIYGKVGKLEINGLGGSYGMEKLIYYKMLPQMGPPETHSWEYPAPDSSWAIEFTEFCEDIRLNRQPSANLEDAKAALTIVEDIYQKSGYDFNVRSNA